MSGFHLHRLLLKNWKKICSNPNLKRVHLLIDNDQDEMLTSLYMEYVLQQANIDSKIVDSDGYEVQLVWKTWMWETVFSDYLEAEKDEKFNQQINGEHPRLCDIL
jgi:glutathionylspermidine synthase